MWSVPGYAPNENELVAMLDTWGKDDDGYVYTLARDRRDRSCEVGETVDRRQWDLLKVDPQRMWAAAEMVGTTLHVLEGPVAVQWADEETVWIQQMETKFPQQWHQKAVISTLMRYWLRGFDDEAPRDIAPLTKAAPTLRALLSRERAWWTARPDPVEGEGPTFPEKAEVLASIAAQEQLLDKLLTVP